jgi:hypothetical protein
MNLVRSAETIANLAAPGGRVARSDVADLSRWQHCTVMRDIIRGNGTFSADGKFRCGSVLDQCCAECIRRFGPFDS